MNKYLTKFQLPIFALAVILAIYGYLTIKDLTDKTSKLKEQNQKISNDFKSLSAKIETDSNRLASYQAEIDNLKNKTTAPRILGTTTPEPITLTKIITQTQTKEIEKNQAVVSIDQIGKFNIDLQEGDTAYTVIKRASKENNFVLKTTDWGGNLGIMIDSIGDIIPVGHQFWAFYYNGALSWVGVSSQLISKSDLIEFRIESW